MVWRWLRELSLQCVHVDNEFHLLCLVKVVTGLDRLSKFSQSFSENPEAAIDLVAVSESNIEPRINNGYQFKNRLCYGACDPMEPLNN